MSRDVDLKPFATETQLRYLEAVEEHGSARAAAPFLDVHHSAISRAVAAVKRKAAIHPRGTDGFAPRELTTHYDADGATTGSTVKEAPESWAAPGGLDAGPERDGHGGFAVKGVSTYFDAEGKQRGQWVKTKVDEQRREELVQTAIAAMCEDLPRLPAIPAPEHTADHLCNLYTMTDCHVGMLAWQQEGGANWDLKIAERVLTGCFAQMITSSPPAATCVINQLGDWLHFDGLDAVTPTSRHLLDADARFEKVVNASLRVLRAMVDLALARHDRVHIIMAEGNHDLASSVWLRAIFATLYENEPRVSVNTSALPYYMHRHGKTVLWFHHGHLKKFDGLPGLFAAQYPTAWGDCPKRYIHMGHCHHEKVQEFPGVKVVQHPTMAARDAHAARHGYISERQATAYTYHVEFGQVGSVTVTPEMLGSGA